MWTLERGPACNGRSTSRTTRHEAAGLRDEEDVVGADTDRPRGQDDLLTPGEVAKLFGVDPKTVTRWASAGKLSPLRTLGGHRRYRATEVYELLERSQGEDSGRSDEDTGGGGGFTGHDPGLGDGFGNR